MGCRSCLRMMPYFTDSMYVNCANVSACINKKKPLKGTETNKVIDISYYKSLNFFFFLFIEVPTR